MSVYGKASLRLCRVLCAAIPALHGAARGDYLSQDFDDWVTPTAYGTYTNNGWILHRGFVLQNFGKVGVLGPYSASEDTDLTSPLGSNGVGTIQWQAMNAQAGKQIEIALEASPDGSSWESPPLAVFTNKTTTGNPTTYNVVVNAYREIHLRILKTGGVGAGDAIYLDNVVISRPPPFVTITNVTLLPETPLVNQTVDVQARIQPFGTLSNLTSFTRFSTNGGVTFSSVSMSTTGSYHYATDPPGIPAQTLPGVIVEYAIRATFNDKDGRLLTNQWPAVGLTTNFVARWSDPAFTNTSYSGWQLFNGMVFDGTAYLNALAAGGETPALVSALYPNGVGSVSFQARNWQPDPIVLELQTSPTGTNQWTVQATYTNTSFNYAWTTFETQLNTYDPLHLRILKAGDGGHAEQYIGIRQLQVVAPPSYVEISDVQILSDPPYVNEPVHVGATIEPFAGAADLEVRVFYTSGTGGRPYASSAAMALTGSNRYETVSGIPGLSTPGQTVRYYVQADFTGNGNLSPMTDPEEGFYSYILRAPPFEAAASNLWVRGSRETDMFLVGDDLWQGIVVTGAPLSNPVFYFESHGLTWGETNQSVFTLPVYGTAEAGQTNIQVLGLATNHLLFQFDTRSDVRTYSVQRSAYTGFDGWGDSSYATHSHPEGWELIGRIGGALAGDETRTNRGAFAVLKYDQPPGAPARYVRSPNLPNGVGTVRFAYRNWNAGGDPAAGLKVQKAAAPGGPWTDIAVLGNIRSVDYLYFSTNLADRESRYVRVLNDTGAFPASWLCVDEFVVSDPGATVAFTNHVPPVGAVAGESAEVWVDVLPFGGATNLSCAVYIRPSGMGYFAAVDMAHTAGNTFRGVLPPSVPGTVEYYFRAAYDGFNAAPAYLPAAGELSVPLFVYTNAPADTAYRRQDFNTWTTPPSSGNYTYQGWTLHTGLVLSAQGWLTANGASLRSPVMTNGIGSVELDCNNNTAGTIVFALQTAAPGDAWETVGVRTNTSVSGGPAPTKHRIEVMDSRDIRFRILTLSGVSGNVLRMDNVFATIAPSDVEISQVHYAPFYPSRNQEVTVTCTITNLNPRMPAYGLLPRIHARHRDGSWDSYPMSAVGGDRFAGTVPPQRAGAVDYYVRCDFGGYFYSQGAYSENRSPAYAPDAPHTAPQPSSFYAYTVRNYHSDYGSLVLTGNTATVMHMIDDDVWQGILTPGTTNFVDFQFAGYDYRTGSEQAPSSNFWGDSQQWRTQAPIVGTFGADGSNVVINVETTRHYLVRFDLNSGEYFVVRCDWQDFDQWYLSADLFAAGSQGGNWNSWVQNFNTWTLDSLATDSTDFEGFWTNATYRSWNYDEQVEDGWVLREFRIVNTVDHRCELLDQANRGRIRQSPIALLDGAGTVSFKLRATDKNTHPTTYAFGSSWTNINLTASVEGLGNNNDDGCYQAFLFRYVNSDNYYQMRVVQTNQTQVFIALYRRKGGSGPDLVKRSANPFNGLLADVRNWQVVVSNNAGKVDYRLTYGSQTLSGTDTDGITSPGTIGFAAYDINMRVKDINGTHDGQDYSEFFGSSTPTGWNVAGAWKVVGGAYERRGRASDPLGLRVSTCEVDDLGNPSKWTHHAHFTNLVELGYSSYNATLHVPQKVYVILDHTFGNGSLRLDDIQVTSWRGKDHNLGGWRTGHAWVTSGGYRGLSRGLELRSSRALNPAGYSLFLRSPLVSSVGPVSFAYRTPSGTTPATIHLQWADQFTPDSWNTVTSDTLDSDGDWSMWSYPMNIDSNGYVRVAQVTTNKDAWLVIDNVEIIDYHESDTNSWIAYNVRISPNVPGTGMLFRGSGQSAYLNHTDDQDIFGAVPYTNYSPYVQTPYLVDGIGEISFWMRRWAMDGGLDYGRLRIEKSQDAETWSLLLATNVTEDAYQFVRIPYYDLSNRFVRISNTITGDVPDRICIDEILVAAPLATDLVVTNLVTVPEVPLYTDDVKVRMTLTDFILGPSNVSASLFYKEGTADWAAWQPGDPGVVEMPMSCVDSNLAVVPAEYVWETDGAIPAKAIDAVVQYYARVSFDGRQLAQFSSPKEHKAFRNPEWYHPADYNLAYGDEAHHIPYYVVYSCPTGSVWINELNALRITWEYGGDEYIELCGPQGANIENWVIKIIRTDLKTNGWYVIKTNPSLHRNPTNGHAFWLLGDAVVNPDQTFTNTPDFYGFNLPYGAGGIQLLRSMGAAEHSISYSTDFGSPPNIVENGIVYEYIGNAGFEDNRSLGLVGTGSTRSDFTWAAVSPMSPGAQNAGQTLEGNAPPPVVWLELAQYVLGTNVQLLVSLENAADPEPWYATNLTETNPWHPVPEYTRQPSNGQYWVRFDYPTAGPVSFFRVNASTNSP